MDFEKYRKNEKITIDYPIVAKVKIISKKYP